MSSVPLGRPSCVPIVLQRAAYRGVMRQWRSFSSGVLLTEIKIKLNRKTINWYRPLFDNQRLGVWQISVYYTYHILLFWTVLVPLGYSGPWLNGAAIVISFNVEGVAVTEQSNTYAYTYKQVILRLVVTHQTIFRDQMMITLVMISEAGECEIFWDFKIFNQI